MLAEKEGKVVQKTKEPITQKRLVEDFHKIGLNSGDTVIVHSSMSQMGWIVGTSVAVINALMEVITLDGTIVMPVFSTDNGNPENWQHPPVPEAWWEIIKENMPPYDPAITPTRGMGRIPETFRKYPGVIRSAHPQCSFAAWGKNKEQICSKHPLTPTFGKKSPLEQLYNLSAKILLLGVDYSNNTALHYAEWKANFPNKPINNLGAAMLEKEQRVWVSFQDLDYNDNDFEELGKEFDKVYKIKTKKIGQADSQLIPMRELIDFAIPWFEKNRK